MSKSEFEIIASDINTPMSSRMVIWEDDKIILRYTHNFKVWRTYCKYPAHITVDEFKQLLAVDMEEC